MADKKGKGGGGGGTNNSTLELLVFGALAAVLITYLGGLLPLIHPVDFLTGIRDYFAPWLSNNLWWLEVVSLLASALFLWGIIHILTVTNYVNMKTEQFLEPWGKDYVSRRRSLTAWKNILKRLNSAEANNWKIAVIESDHMLNEILKMSGYLGKMSDQLKLLSEEQLKNIEEIRRAHAIAEKVRNDPSFLMTQDEAGEVVMVYKQAFIELNLIQE